MCSPSTPIQSSSIYLNLYKMGEGPLYSFFIPYHLVHFEVPNAIARVVLFRDNLAAALAGPVVEVCAVAKRDLKAGEILDDYGMYMTYGEAVNVDEMSTAAIFARGTGRGLQAHARHQERRRPHLQRRRAASEPSGRPVAGRTIPAFPRRNVARRPTQGAA